LTANRLTGKVHPVSSRAEGVTVPDAKGNQHASGDQEVGPEQNLTEQELPDATGTASSPSPKPPKSSDSGS
jgi:hypothetical protein